MLSMPAAATQEWDNQKVEQNLTDFPQLLPMIGD
jgi:hypothetical protein